MSHRYLLMWLEAPLQSWGVDSKFSRRDTLNFPTKSGIFGLLCSALGAGGEQRVWLATMAPLSQTVISFAKKVNYQKPEYKTTLCDFHMVGSGYDDKDPWQNLCIPKKQDGKKATGPNSKLIYGTKLTYRYYLQDAFFAAIVQVPSEFAKALEEALKAPVWDLYFGRKTCVPTDFIYRGLFDSEVEAIDAGISVAQKKSLVEDFRVLDGKQPGDETMILNDVPLQFGQNKQYKDRFVTLIFNTSFSEMLKNE